jgi:MFS family permease
MLNSIVSKKAVISLMLARIFYTVNWFNVPSIFIFIAVDFDEDISVLGLITASFFIGVGLFQVLAGILAVKYSPRKIAILGIAIYRSFFLCILHRFVVYCSTQIYCRIRDGFFLWSQCHTNFRICGKAI